MGGNGKHRRWKISFYHRSSSSTDDKQPPKEFVCPVSGSLMFDPVVVSSGQTFDRVSVDVCRELGFVPVMEDGLRPDFSAVFPNLAMKQTIFKWCDSSGIEHPSEPDYGSVKTAVMTKMESERSLPSSSSSRSTPDIRFSERELLRGVAENPPVRMSHAATELNPRVNHFYSSSSEESVVVVPPSPLTPLPLTTRPACYSASTSSSSSLTEITDATETITHLNSSFDAGRWLRVVSGRRRGCTEDEKRRHSLARRRSNQSTKVNEIERRCEGFSMYAESALCAPASHRFEILRRTNKRDRVAGQSLTGKAKQGHDRTVRIRSVVD
ncbi:hypothetical protein Dsin_005413 [Dipteronia sinensis]|uniref:U-box domain-containing protein n=1 Tax=Dipteronia sinensis TaxID=43782 RepID=A0AAE0AWD9_9ROSI|nr:hypothetical protein Dsin_005413 [Dipteronia sinensis]